MHCLDSLQIRQLGAGVRGDLRMTFVIGEKVVYPNQGIGTIENISSRAFGAQFEKFYLLKLLCSKLPLCILSEFSLKRNFQSLGQSVSPLPRNARTRDTSLFLVILRSPMLVTFENGTITVMLL